MIQINNLKYQNAQFNRQTNGPIDQVNALTQQKNAPIHSTMI